jgi:hypothetical protein
MIRKLWQTIDATLDLLTAEMRTGIKQIEAAEVDAFEAQLRYVTTSAEERSNLRAAAIELGKCGLTADDVAPMAQAYCRAKWRAEG